MIVDDDPDQRQLICDAIGIHYTMCAAPEIVALSSGQECLRHDPRNFDVILLDYQLPDMAGLAVLDQIVASSDTAVLFVTGQNDAATAAEAIRRGAQDYVIKHGDYLFAVPVIMEKAFRQQSILRENARLQQELQSMLLELRQKNRQLELTLSKVKDLAKTDYLTGLTNRRYFSDVLDRSFAEAVRYGHDLTCCMCDLDNYKKINDTMGHQTGDEILTLAADAIRSSLRECDLAARYGGDEIVIILPHTSAQMAQNICERIRQSFATMIAKRPKLATLVTMSVGVASIVCNHPETPAQLVMLADRALYQAKEQGKNCVVAFAPQAPAIVG